ncbi:hypothetical protein GJAV_G00034110 [Gymnothorax javanicus]|nr:hypothetical protein GJAV_G00034110 [Gymnothorax javanicus]
MPPNNTTPTTASYGFDYTGDYDDNDMHVYGIAADEVAKPLIYMYVTVYSLVILLGLPLHTLVICMITCRLKKTPDTVWFLWLSVMDLAVILFLPFRLVSALQEFTWMFTAPLCKFCSFLMFMNMHSTALLISFLSMTRCLSDKGCCSRDVSNGAVVVSWVIGGLLSVPSLVMQSLKDTSRGVVCQESGWASKTETEVITAVRFLTGWLCPLCVAVASSLCVCTKGKRVLINRIIKGIIMAFFLCWLPYHVLVLIKLRPTEVPEKVMKVGLPVSTALAFFNSCINPFIYIVMEGSLTMAWTQEDFPRHPNEITSEPKSPEAIPFQSIQG